MGAGSGLGAGSASTESDAESSVMGWNSEGVMAVVLSSEISGDWRELSPPPAPSSSPGHDPGVTVAEEEAPSTQGSTVTSGGRWWSDVLLEKRWWAEKDLGSSCFFCRDEERCLLLLLAPLKSSRKPESSPSFTPEPLMQLMKTFLFPVDEEEDEALSKSSVWDLVIFLCL